MQVHGRAGRVGRVGDALVVGLALDLELAALPGEDLGARAREGVCRAGGELGAVLLSRAGEELDGEGTGVRGLEAPFLGGREGDDARGGGGWL